MSEKSLTVPIYLDTNVFIAGLEGDFVVSNPVKRLFDWLKLNSKCAITSELTLAELVAPEYGKSDMHADNKRALYLELVFKDELFQLRAITRDILIATANIRRGNRLKLADAIHFATAINVRAQYFLSFDRDARKVPSTIAYMEPTDAGIDRVLAALDG